MSARDNGTGWNNGWGAGSGSVNSSVNFAGRRRGSGNYRDRDGRTQRLDAARVNISPSGDLRVDFDSDRGRIEFSGRVDRRDGRRIFSQVNGNEMYGAMEIEMSSPSTVSRITLRAVNLNWSN